MLFAATLLSNGDIAIAVLTAVVMLLLSIVAVAGVKAAFRKDDQIENRRKEAIKIAGFMRDVGLNHSAKFFNDYAVGDLSGMWNEAKAILGILEDENLRRASLFSVVEHTIPRVMKSEAEVRRCLSLAHAAAVSANFDLHKMMEEEIAKNTKVDPNDEVNSTSKSKKEDD